MGKLIVINPAATPQPPQPLTENFIKGILFLVILVTQMVLSIGERIKGFLFSPSDTFDASKEDTLGDPLKYFIVILAIYAVLSAIIAAVASSLIAEKLGMFGALLLAAMGPLITVVFFIWAFVSGIIGIWIGGLWTHIWVYIVGGRKGIEQTLKAVMYGATPSYLLGWILSVYNIAPSFLLGLIPIVVGIIAGIWALIVGIIGIRQLHELSTGKAVLAVILAIIIPIVVIAIALMLLGGFTPMQGPTGPGFGGF
jgi:hypothetical protein